MGRSIQTDKPCTPCATTNTTTNVYRIPCWGSQQIEDTDDHFKTVIKAGGIMDVVECYPWTGEVLTHGRRDKRKGVHTGRVLRTPEGPSIQYVGGWV